MSPAKTMLTSVENATSYLSSPTVKILVGSEETRTFFVHKDLLTSRSRFFSKAFKGYGDGAGASSSSASTEAVQWKEGEEGAVELPDDDPAVFDAYLQLLYSSHLPICGSVAEQPTYFGMSAEEKKTAKEEFEAAEDDKVDQEFNLLARVYILTEKIRDDTGKKSLLSAFVESTSKLRYDNSAHYPEASIINLVYDNTLPGDSLREFLADCYVLIGNPEWAGTSSTAFNHDFLFDLMVGMFKMRARPSDVSKIKDAKVYIEKLKADEE